jgi:hypothetical protein
VHQAQGVLRVFVGVMRRTLEIPRRFRVVAAQMGLERREPRFFVLPSFGRVLHRVDLVELRIGQLQHFARLGGRHDRQPERQPEDLHLPAISLSPVP